MENLAMYFLAVVISFLIILSVMKFLKFLWNNVIYKILLFFKPELKNIYDLGKWFRNLLKKKK